MTLATFPMIILRWKRSNLFREEYAEYVQLTEYLPPDIFIERFNTLDEHILREYPHVWIDTYLFFTAICFVIATAAFSIVARAADLSMWYPLIMLLIPAVIGFITTRRRNKYYKKLATYYESLQSVLKQFNSLDVTRQIKWNFRRLRETDTANSMHLNIPLSRCNINFVIEIIQVNIENELAEEGEILPAYDTSMMDIVLDIGPAVERGAPGNRSDYIVPMPQQAVLPRQSHPSPPAYERNESLELEPVHPPPAYLNDPLLSSNR
ncbi:hypothetical protein EDC94DRAFT_605961 [Helicostylum pulchrum]|uniref:Uncharacterized protein n=1 Tax=Helicostylum pulchrum TaxID=562976 RepID=A0ABP9Y834_9FUNG|nr:hypothetical protein EDC94DRAFT_605961 [Helicostylum pulchrum]